MDRVKEGDLYKLITVGNIPFEIRYGFYGDIERAHCEPMPIYPNFVESPRYTIDGYPFVTADQEVCEHFKPKPKISSEGWCNDCEYLEKHEEFIGVCKCKKRKINL